MNHGVEQCTLSNHPAHTLPQAMISEKKNRKITSKFLKTLLMNLHEQICFLKDKSIKVNNSDRTNRKAEEEKCGKDFCKWYFFPVSGTNILFLAVSDWIWSITETACQSTDKKATSFFFSLCTVQVGIFDFIHHLQIAVGIPESQFDFTKWMNEKKKCCWFCVCCFWKLHTWDFGKLGITNDSLSQCYSENAEASFNPQGTCSSECINYLHFTGFFLLVTLNNSEKRNTTKLSFSI